MKIVNREKDGAMILDVSGDIDLYNSPEIRKALLEALQNKSAKRVVVNLKDVRYIDSSGVASLVEGLKKARERSQRFILFGLSNAAREVLELSRLIKVFEVYATEEEALKS